MSDEELAADIADVQRQSEHAVAAALALLVLVLALLVAAYLGLLPAQP